MHHSSSTTSSPSPKSSFPDLRDSSLSKQNLADDATEVQSATRPRLSFAGPATGALLQHGRRPSIQFANCADTIARTAKPRPALMQQKRLSSPPPPSTYESRVSFDTFDNKDATDISFTLVSKHKNYNYSRRSRTFLCGTDQNDYSEFALEWLVEELIEDGDEIGVRLFGVSLPNKAMSCSHETCLESTASRSFLTHVLGLSHDSLLIPQMAMLTLKSRTDVHFKLILHSIDGDMWQNQVFQPCNVIY